MTDKPVDLKEQRRKVEAERVRKKVEHAVSNGIRITFSVKPQDTDLDFTRTLRRVYKKEEPRGY